MNTLVLVQIVGAPVACANGVNQTWREIAAWTAEQLRYRFGESVRTDYYDLFDPDCPALPPDAQLPCVLVDGAVLSSGGKISVPTIRQRVEALLRLQEQAG
jgi:hypothetical protein